MCSLPMFKCQLQVSFHTLCAAARTWPSLRSLPRGVLGAGHRPQGPGLQPRFPALSSQLGIPHSFALISYQHKFQDDDQTRVKGSLK